MELSLSRAVFLALLLRFFRTSHSTPASPQTGLLLFRRQPAVALVFLAGHLSLAYLEVELEREELASTPFHFWKLFRSGTGPRIALFCLLLPLRDKGAC